MLVGVAVERTEPKGFGRCRLTPLSDASASSLRAFLADNVEPGARVITDGWQPYRPATAGLYVHERLPGAQRSRAHELLPGVHKVSSFAKRWLLGTHQGAVEEAHLPAYLDEFAFRFNRRRSRSRGSSSTACSNSPSYTARCATATSSQTLGRAGCPARPPITRGRPPSMERPPAGRPWRAVD